METLQYSIIKSEEQYNIYCDRLEALTGDNITSGAITDEIQLLTLLVEKYDQEHNSFTGADPVELIKFLMKEHRMKAIYLAKLLGVSAESVSDILSYKKKLSTASIRMLSERFKVRQMAFNRSYQLSTLNTQ